jgi:hypothetical protein
VDVSKPLWDVVSVAEDVYRYFDYEVNELVKREESSLVKADRLIQLNPRFTRLLLISRH